MIILVQVVRDILLIGETKTKPDEKETSGIDDAQLSDERREFLKKCGKFAAYTAPAIAVLLLFDKRKAHAASAV